MPRAHLFFTGALLVSLAVAQPPAPAPTLSQMLARISKEAEAFRRIAPTTISQETLEQRTLIMTQAPEAVAINGPAGATYETHEVISVYGYATAPNAPNALHEVRKVVSVDAHEVTSVEKARHAMTLGLNSSDIKLKKRLLEDFERHGLHGAATDFGQALLLFTPPHLRDYTFEIRGERQIGADRLLILSYTQIAGAGGITVFRGNTAVREPLHGEILVRKKDSVPMRITMVAVSSGKDFTIKDESTIDYADSEFGSVLPASVSHREYLKETLISENTFFYAMFRKSGQSPAELP